MQARFDLAIIPCTSGKHANGLTPLTLYRGGIFSVMMRHAALRADKILIMSAKYGLLGLGDPVSWYNAYLPTLSPAERTTLIAVLRAQINPGWSDVRVLSYLPKFYYETLLEANPTVVSKFKRPYRNLGHLPLVKVLSREITNYDQFPSRR